MFSFLAKAAASTAISGYATRRLLSASMLSHPARVFATSVGSFAGLAYYMKVWINDYYFDWDYNANRDLTGRTAIVTGGTVDGLGHAAAKLLYQQGAKVIITVRTKEKGEAALKQLKNQESSPVDDERFAYVICDFLSESSIRNCVAEIKTKTSDGIDFLVLNAGIGGRSKKKKDSSETDEKEKDTQAAKVWLTNHVGPWIFAQELMSSLIQAAKRNPSEHPRVVWVSSGAHKRAAIYWEDPFNPHHKSASGSVTLSYGQSKLANIMHAREYQKRVRDLLQIESEKIDGDENLDIKCFSVTPGLVWTNIIPKIRFLYPLFWLIMRSTIKGAQVIKMACLDNDLKGGEYLSNCYVKESLGIDGCSNDEEQWGRLWELTAKHVEEKEYEKFIEDSNGNKKTN